MFGLLSGLVNAAVSAATLLMADVLTLADKVTMGGALIDRDEPHTVNGCKTVVKNLENAVKPE